VRFLRPALALAPFAIAGCSRAAAALPSNDNHAASDGFAVVELFTSESCSSCPPADDVLRELAADAAQSGRHVYPLAFHVDYWNDLGWRDRFSSALATRRQNAYSQTFGQHSVYTPQMIVNGRDAFVGSERQRALQSIETALTESPPARIALQPITLPGAFAVDYTISSAPPGANLQAALVERQAVSQITSGENAGRTLRHANVVREFQTLSASENSKGRISFAVPSGNSARYEVIAYLQDPTTMRVSAAARADL
jgi:hypothetical protein